MERTLSPNTPNPGPTSAPKALSALVSAPRPIATDAALVLLFMVAIYHSVFSYPCFNPEFAAAWHQTHSVTFSQVLHRYIEFGTPFYRPTFWYLFLWLLGKLVDFHHIYALKALAFAFLFVVSLLQYTFVRLVLRGDRVAAQLATLYLLVNPSLYITVTELFFHEYLGLSLLLACCICFYISLGYKQPLFNGWWILSIVLCFLAITSRELLAPAPVWLGLLSSYHLITESGGLKKIRLRALTRHMLHFAPLLAQLILYYVLQIRRLPHMAVTGAYRTDFNAELVVSNCKRMMLWMAHFFTMPLHDYIDVHNTKLNLAMGVCLLAVVLAGAVLCYRRDRPKFSRSVVLLLSWIVIFMLIPVLGGYAPWHIVIALAGYSALFGLLASSLTFALSERLGRAAVILAVVAMTIVGARNYADQLMRSGRFQFYQLNAGALLSPPVPAKLVPDKSLIFYQDRIGLNDWAFGGGNFLFRYVYDNPSLVEKRIVGEPTLQDEILWLRSRRSLFFACTESLSWIDATKQFAKESLHAVMQYTDGLLAAGEYQKTADLLQPIVKRFPQHGILRYQYAYATEKLGLKEESRANMLQSIDLLPNSFWLYFNRGQLNNRVVDWDRVCADVRRELQAGNEYPGMSKLSRALCLK